MQAFFHPLKFFSQIVRLIRQTQFAQLLPGDCVFRSQHRRGRDKGEIQGSVFGHEHRHMGCIALQYKLCRQNGSHCIQQGFFNRFECGNGEWPSKKFRQCPVLYTLIGRSFGHAFQFGGFAKFPVPSGIVASYPAHLVVTMVTIISRPLGPSKAHARP